MRIVALLLEFGQGVQFNAVNVWVGTLTAMCCGALALTLIHSGRAVGTRCLNSNSSKVCPKGMLRLPPAVLCEVACDDHLDRLQ
jgi:hypothetical protein